MNPNDAISRFSVCNFMKKKALLEMFSHEFSKIFKTIFNF